MPVSNVRAAALGVAVATGVAVAGATPGVLAGFGVSVLDNWEAAGLAEAQPVASSAAVAHMDVLKVTSFLRSLRNGPKANRTR